MKTENWNGHAIRFVEKDGQWWAVAADVIEALGYENVSRTLQDYDERRVGKYDLPHLRFTGYLLKPRRYGLREAHLR
jgi:prophage antirepressor-like protein